MEILSVDVNPDLYLNLIPSQVVDLNVYEIQTVTRDISVRVRDVWSDQILVTPPLVVLIPSVQTKEETLSANVKPGLSPNLTLSLAVTVNASQILTVARATFVPTTNAKSVLILATLLHVALTPCVWRTG